GNIEADIVERKLAAGVRLRKGVDADRGLVHLRSAHRSAVRGRQAKRVHRLFTLMIRVILTLTLYRRLLHDPVFPPPRAARSACSGRGRSRAGAAVRAEQERDW